MIREHKGQQGSRGCPAVSETAFENVSHANILLKSLAYLVVSRMNLCEIFQYTNVCRRCCKWCHRTCTSRFVGYLLIIFLRGSYGRQWWQAIFFTHKPFSLLTCIIAPGISGAPGARFVKKSFYILDIS